jgi:hypothetical protein
MMSSEYANDKHKRGKVRSIEDVPAFRQHLERNGLKSLAEFEARQRQQMDLDVESLSLQRRFVQSKARARASAG